MASQSPLELVHGQYGSGALTFPVKMEIVLDLLALIVLENFS